MPIIIACAHCRKKLKVPDSAPGKKVRCPQCGEIFSVPLGTTRIEAIAPVKAAPPPVPPPLPPALEPIRSGARNAENAAPVERDKFVPITFNVNIRNDPARELKGFFEAKVDRRGMTFRQKK